MDATMENLNGKIKKMQDAVVDWYLENGDAFLPWRRTRNPWHVLIASFLLKKTTTEQVLSVYPVLVKKFPEPDRVLEADIDEIKDVIRTLGLENQRSKHLLQLASTIKKEFGGKIPCSLNELLKLPGVGYYIASEVLLVSCRQPRPLLDRNMIRIIERVFGYKSDKKRPHTDKKMWEFAEKLVPSDPEKAILFNYGILDIARKICRPKKPSCNKCPLKKLCIFYSRK